MLTTIKHLQTGDNLKENHNTNSHLEVIHTGPEDLVPTQKMVSALLLQRDLLTITTRGGEPHEGVLFPFQELCQRPLRINNTFGPQ